MPDITTFSEKLPDLIYTGAVDVMKDIFKAAIIGGFLLVVNLFAKERHEQQNLNRIKNYEELLRLKAKMTTADGYSTYLDDRISYLGNLMKIKPRPYGPLDIIFSNLFSVVAVLCTIALFFLDSEVRTKRWVIAFVFALIIGLVCYLNWNLGKRASERLANPFVRVISQLLVSFTVSTIGVMLGFFSLIISLTDAPK